MESNQHQVIREKFSKKKEIVKRENQPHFPPRENPPRLPPKSKKDQNQPKPENSKMKSDQHQVNNKKISRKKPNSTKGKQPREFPIKKIPITREKSHNFPQSQKKSKFNKIRCQKIRDTQHQEK